MSVQALSCAFAIRGLSASEKLVLLALSNFANDQMQCWPSQDRLAADTELSARTVWGALKGLEDKSILQRTSRKRSDGSRTTDIFTLHFALQVWSEPVADIASRPRNSCENHSQDLRDDVAAVARPTTFEPSTEPSEEPLEAAPPPKPRRSRFVPDVWTIPDRTHLDLIGDGFSPGEIERELAKFRDHEFRDPKSDWNRAFRKWMRTSRQMSPAPHERHSPDAKLAAKQANYARAWEGSERAARFRGEP